MLEDLITQKGQTHCQAMPKKQYVIQCNPQMFRNDFRSTYTYARLYPHYFCNPKLPASQQPGNAECLHVASDTDCLCLGAFVGPDMTQIPHKLNRSGSLCMLVGHVLGILLQRFGFLLHGASFGQTRAVSGHAINVAPSPQLFWEQPGQPRLKPANAKAQGSSRSPSAVRGVRCANLPLRPALAIIGCCNNARKLEIVDP